MTKFFRILSKLIIGLIKFYSVLFLFLVIFDGFSRTIFSSPDFMDKEYKIVRSYQNDNVVILNGFSHKIENNNEQMVLRYTLIPYSLKMPKLLEITTTNKEVKAIEKENILTIIFSLIFMVFGAFTFYRFTRKYGGNFKIGRHRPVT